MSSAHGEYNRTMLSVLYGDGDGKCHVALCHRLATHAAAMQALLASFALRKPSSSAVRCLCRVTPHLTAVHTYPRTPLFTGLELSTYQFLEGLLPMPIPQFYFGDISRASSNYLLITECVPFAARGPTTASTLLDWRDTPPKAPSGRIEPATYLQLPCWSCCQAFADAIRLVSRRCCQSRASTKTIGSRTHTSTISPSFAPWRGW